MVKTPNDGGYSCRAENPNPATFNRRPLPKKTNNNIYFQRVQTLNKKQSEQPKTMLRERDALKKKVGTVQTYV